MLNKDQAESASAIMLAERRKEQAEFAHTIATKYRPFSTFLRFTVSGVTGLAVGAIYGSQDAGRLIFWCSVGLAAGIAYGFWLGHMRRRRLGCGPWL